MFKRENMFSVLIMAVLVLLFASTVVRAAENRDTQQESKSGIVGDISNAPQFVLYYASVACSCTMARCQAALTLCDSMLAGDATHIYRTVDVYIDTLTADSVGIEEVPALVFFDCTGQEKERVEWDITADDVHRLVQKGEER